MTSPTFVSPGLAAVYERAGASDQDRAAWMLQRRGGLTATQIRDLMIGAISEQRLIDQKLGRIPDQGDLSHVPLIAWGRAREAVIADKMRGEGLIPESRVFHHVNNPRHLASPDAVQESWDGKIIVGEYKTAAHDLPPGSKDLEAKGYEWQMVWEMYVLGAEKCRFVVEERITVAENVFEVGPMHPHWIGWDERRWKMLGAMLERAEAFLAELDRQAAEGAPEVDEEIDTHAFNYLRGLDAEKAGAALKTRSYAALLAAGKSQQSALHRVTYTPEKPGAVTSVPETDFEKAKRARGGKALFAALQAAQDAARDAQAAWDAHCARFTVDREVVGKGSGARVTVTRVKQQEVQTDE